MNGPCRKQATARGAPHGVPRTDGCSISSGLKSWNEEWNFSPVPEISGIFRIFLALFLRTSRHFVIAWPFLWESGKSSSKFRRKFAKFSENRGWNEMKFVHSGKNLDEFLLKFWNLSGAKECKSCRSRKTLQNEPLVAIVAVDTAENEPLKVWGWFHPFFNPLLRGAAFRSSREPALGRVLSWKVSHIS